MPALSSVVRFPRVLIVLLLIAAAYGVYTRLGSPRAAPREDPRPLVVRAAVAHTGSVDVYFQALGTVTSPGTVTVKSRVDGQLMALHFLEGQSVLEGDLLAEIDPRPFEVKLMQAKGDLARDEALLKDARLDLERYRKLVKEQSVSQQQVQAQESLVGQYEGAVLSGKASVADAELQLAYSHITAPAAGRVGLRTVDVGNMIRASDSGGIVVITQMQPMNVIFTLVEKQIQDVIEAMRSARPLTVEAWGQDSRNCLAVGELLTIDNQIDTATGTVRAKAVFSNADGRLFPNQFVNVRLKVRTLKDVLLIPSSAVQRNTRGFFVHVVAQDGTTRGRDITVDYATDSETVVATGLSPGDIVVTDGVDRLRDGLRVTYEDGVAHP
jgi:multidrug efflux system membrane fusion protein